MRRDLWVDFNEVGDDARVCTLRRFASPGVSLSVGQQVVVGDDEGNRCDAQIISLTNDFVELAVDGDTFRASQALRNPLLARQ